MRWPEVAAVGLVLLLVGCGAQEYQQGETCAVYFREADLAAAGGGDALRAEQIPLEAGDAQEQAQMLLAALLEGPEDETLKSTIPAGTQLLSLKLERGRAMVDFSSQYAMLSGVGLTMADCAIVLTLTQLPEILSVKITVRGQELAYRDKQILTARDVRLATQGDVVGTVEATLYFLDENQVLAPEERILELYEGDTQVEIVVRALEDGPESKGLFAVLPEGFRMRSVWLEENVCYVNLSSAQLDDIPRDTELGTAIYAVCRSLVSLDSVQEVRFLVDGEFARTYGTVNIASSYLE